MSPSGAEFIRQVKSQIDEVDPSEVSEHLGDGITVVDVREADEVEQGKVPGAVHVPRGFLESRIEGAAPDRSQRVVLYCASGNRSALAAKTLVEERLHVRGIDLGDLALDLADELGAGRAHGEKLLKGGRD